MGNLIKYEFIRKWRTLCVFLAIILGMNAVVIYELRSGVNSYYSKWNYSIFTFRSLYSSSDINWVVLVSSFRLFIG
ncbi:MAG: hypothetical protein GX434_13685 [Peptococcaceae bacterium]|nr:hypothetical protein [Peptococcaceae bacterium]